MVSPLDLEWDELLVYHQLYLRSDFNTGVTEYTDRQIEDSLRKAKIGRSRIKTILKKFIRDGLFIEIAKGKRGNNPKPAIGKLVKIKDIIQSLNKPNADLNQTLESIENTNIENANEPNMNLNQTLNDPHIKEKGIKNKKIYVETSNEYRLAKYLFELIRKNNPEFKEPNIQTWALHIDRMIRIDKREISDIKIIMEWCQNHDFWYSKILSTDKLRKQYDQLFMQMKPKNQQLNDRPKGRVIEMQIGGK